MKTFRSILNESLPDIYPEVQSPVKAGDLKSSFEFFNKKLFRGSLKTPRIKFAPLAKNFYGKAHVKYNPSDFSIKDSLITISTKIKNDNKMLLDTLIHEMIHIWQYEQNAKSKSYKYSEATWSEVLGSNDKHTYGHNSYFLEKMNEFNKLGYDITVEGDAPNGIELTDPIYGVMFDDGSSPILLWSPNDPTDKIQNVIDDIVDRTGRAFNNYTIFRTTESNLTLSTRLTKAFRLPKNVINIQFRSDWVDSIVNSKLSSIMLNNNLTKDGDSSSDRSNAQQEVIDMLSLTRKFRNNSWSSFFQTVYFNAFPGWRSIKGTELYSDEKEFNGVRQPNDLTDESADAIYRSWLDISDAEMKRSSLFKYFTTNFKFWVMKKKHNPRDITSLKRDYDNDYSMRISEDKFKVLLFEAMFSKFKKDITKEDFKKSYVFLTKDTWLEI